VPEYSISPPFLQVELFSIPGSQERNLKKWQISVAQNIVSLSLDCKEGRCGKKQRVKSSLFYL
jgi:hypothetical protein